MVENNEISEYITFPRTFERYRWYKPLLVFILGLILMVIFDLIVTFIFGTTCGWDFIDTIATGGYEVLNDEMGEIISDLGIIIIIPSLYIASRIVRDRPFSSYSSSRGGWNWKLYLKALIIPFMLQMIFNGIDIAINGGEGTYHFTITFLIATLILVPLQCIAEEYAFRGLIMQTFGSWFKIPILAIILQSIIFAAVHGYNNIGLAEIFISGIVFGFFAWKTNGIEVSSALHTANNLSISLFVMFGLHSTSSTVQLEDAAITIVFEVLLCILMYYIGKKTSWFGEIGESPQDI